jgi:NADPH-dependent 2,4-dienoyl-CoA reductase/sulfur reductase-like enzyme
VFDKAKTERPMASVMPKRARWIHAAVHVCPAQRAPRFVRESPLADKAGWVEVDPATLQHPRYRNISALGDASSAPNAKTAARKQAPVVAENVLAVLGADAPRAIYDGYGACPLTVERGKVVPAEFVYSGKLLPTFPFLSPISRAFCLVPKKRRCYRGSIGT